MSESEETPLWIWVGFEGSTDVATAGKLITDALPSEIAGVKIPLPGEPPMTWDEEGIRAMWAIQCRPDNIPETPEGCIRAKESLVGRMVGG